MNIGGSLPNKNGLIYAGFNQDQGGFYSGIYFCLR